MVNLGIQAGLSAGVASLVLQFSAFFTILLGALVFRETLSKYQAIGMAVALLGLSCIILVTDGTVTLVGVVLVIVGAISWSIANIIIKQSGCRDMLAFLVWSSLFSPLPLLAMACLMQGSAGHVALAIRIDAAALLSILFQAYPTTMFGYWVWNWLLKKYPVSTVAPLSLLVPIFGMLGSIVIFDETLAPAKLLAIVLIISGLMIGLYGKPLVTKLSRRILPAP